MKLMLFFLLVIGLACNNNPEKSEKMKPDSIKTMNDTASASKNKKFEPASETYSNKRFENVSVERLSENKFRIRGRGQIFEASFGWRIEDGHEEIDSGFQMTDAGAPEWGNFNFTIDLPENKKTATLTLILFETSARDGSRQYELPIPLK